MTSTDKPLVWLRGEVKTWRLVYRLDADAIVTADMFQKTTAQTPARVIADCARRLKQYDRLIAEE